MGGFFVQSASDNGSSCPQGGLRSRVTRSCKNFLKNPMPFIRTSVHKDTPPEQRQAIVDGIHQALVDGIGMPADERSTW